MQVKIFHDDDKSKLEVDLNVFLLTGVEVIDIKFSSSNVCHFTALVMYKTLDEVRDNKIDTILHPK